MGERTVEWTKDEDRVLRECWETQYYPATAAMAELPFRSRSSINHRAKKLGLTREKQYWTPEEDDMLRAAYGRFSSWAESLGACVAENLSLEMRRTPAAIATRADILGVRPRRARKC